MPRTPRIHPLLASLFVLASAQMVKFPERVGLPARIRVELGAEITQSLARMATIGIGAGPDCSGQVLVLHDMLGVYPGKKPRFTKDFMAGAASIADAVERYVRDVKAGTFPAPENCY